MLKDKLKKSVVVPVVAAAAIAGVGTGILSYASATHAATTTSVATSPSTTSGATDTTSTASQSKPQGHAPLGDDGNITAINGTTITMQEEADEGGGYYTVDASNATFNVNGTTGSISSFKVGDKIFIQGTVNGTNVTATSVSVGHPHGPRPSDTTQPTTSTTQ